MTDSRPIGIFDSGVGGLTVLNQLKKQLPYEQMIYVGDTARAPYGNKSQQLIQQYSQEISEFLISKNCKMIIVACNTASSLSLEYLRSKHSLPIEGVIEAGVEEAIKETTNNQIGVLGTHSTIQSGAYEIKLKEYQSNIHVTNQACPLFVPLAEEGWVEGEIPENIARVYLKPLIDSKVDSVILGCTHYPILKRTIYNVLPKDVKLVDSGEAVSQKVIQILSEKELMAPSDAYGHLECFVTDLPSQFSKVAKRFVDFSIDKVKTIELHSS